LSVESLPLEELRPSLGTARSYFFCASADTAGGGAEITGGAEACSTPPHPGSTPNVASSARPAAVRIERDIDIVSDLLFLEFARTTRLTGSIGTDDEMRLVCRPSLNQQLVE
jgi:hypothetical protein